MHTHTLFDLISDNIYRYILLKSLLQLMYYVIVNVNQDMGAVAFSPPPPLPRNSPHAIKYNQYGYIVVKKSLKINTHPLRPQI